MTDNDKLTPHQAQPLAQPSGHTFVDFLREAARDPSIDVAKLRELVMLGREQEEREAERLYNVDMAALQAELEPIAKSGVNPYLQSRYVRLEDLLAVVRPLFDKYGFAPGYDSKMVGETHIEFSCEMKHRAGHSKTNHLTLPIDGTGSKGGKSQMNAIQSVGSTTSYARRYLLEMHLNISRKDDDNDGSGAPIKVTEAQAAQIAEALAKSATDPARFWRFMSMGQPVAITRAEDVYARDFKRAMAFFQVTRKSEET